MSYLMKCEKCGVTGELDEYMDEFQCPQCGGTMFPVSDKKKNANTVSISREQVNEYKDIKVAKAVTTTFGEFTSNIPTQTTVKKAEAVASPIESAPVAAAAAEGASKSPAKKISVGSGHKKIVFGKKKAEVPAPAVDASSPVKVAKAVPVQSAEIPVQAGAAEEEEIINELEEKNRIAEEESRRKIEEERLRVENMKLAAEEELRKQREDLAKQKAEFEAMELKRKQAEEMEKLRREKEEFEAQKKAFEEAEKKKAEEERLRKEQEEIERKKRELAEELEKKRAEEELERAKKELEEMKKKAEEASKAAAAVVVPLAVKQEEKPAEIKAEAAEEPKKETKPAAEVKEEAPQAAEDKADEKKAEVKKAVPVVKKNPYAKPPYGKGTSVKKTVPGASGLAKKPAVPADDNGAKQDAPAQGVKVAKAVGKPVAKVKVGAIEIDADKITPEMMNIIKAKKRKLNLIIYGTISCTTLITCLIIFLVISKPWQKTGESTSPSSEKSSSSFSISKLWKSTDGKSKSKTGSNKTIKFSKETAGEAAEEATSSEGNASSSASGETKKAPAKKKEGGQVVTLFSIDDTRFFSDGDFSMGVFSEGDEIPEGSLPPPDSMPTLKSSELTTANMQKAYNLMTSKLHRGTRREPLTGPQLKENEQLLKGFLVNFDIQKFQDTEEVKSAKKELKKIQSALTLYKL